MSVADQGLGSIVAGLESGEGGGGAVIQEGASNIRANRTGEISNGTFGEDAYGSTLLGTGNSEGSYVGGNFNAILGGDSNYIDASLSSVAGGDFNFMPSFDTGEGIYKCTRMFIGGGSSNYLQQDWGFIGAGLNNRIYTGAPNVEGHLGSALVSGTDNYVVGGLGFLGGGSNNHIGEDNEGSLTVALNSVLVGGTGNRVQTHNSFVGGGDSNEVYDHNSFLGGGAGNLITAPIIGEDSGFQVLVGGASNETYGRHNFIGGGQQNRIGGGSEGQGCVSSTLSGGLQNIVGPGLTGATIIGGGNNTVEGQYGTILGGNNNYVGGAVEGGIAMGLQAYASTGNYQRAFAGGQYATEGLGSRQLSEYVYRGNTDGEDGSTVQLGAGGNGADPTFTAIEGVAGKSYGLVADCVARDDAGITSYQVIRALLHIDGDGTGHLVAGTPDDPIEYGSPPAGWEFTFAYEGGGIRLYFTVGAGNTNTVKAVSTIRATEVGSTPP